MKIILTIVILLALAVLVAGGLMYQAYKGRTDMGIK